MNNKMTLFSKIGKTRIIPISLKILIIFIVLILFSNFATNYVSLQLSKREIINLNNKIMVEQLKELYSNSTNQFQIYSYSKNKEETNSAMKNAALTGFSYENSVAFGVKSNGDFDFLACNNPSVIWTRFSDREVLDKIQEDFVQGKKEGSISFSALNGDYFGVYKFQEEWGYYLVRAELRSDLNKSNQTVFLYTSILIMLFTIFFLAMGALILRREFRVLHNITENLVQMQKNKQLDIIDLSEAPNDDITYLAASFNSLSSSVNNLLFTFQKFVSKDVVNKAYKEQGIGLMGDQRELTLLFSDIKSFTFRTETLQREIIELLNVHYNKVIHNVHENNGDIGSIIGDAILAVFGALESKRSKSYNAILAAWDITHVTAKLRGELARRRVEIEQLRKLTDSEQKVFEAVSVDVGVGIDGGNVFYGTIGSLEHMTNTVIGDNVNAASRLEGLTRIYHLPVIVSGYVKDEVQKETARYKFFEIDMVQVKGKTEGKRIYFPFDTNEMDENLIPKFEIYERGLEAYYAGDWKTARKEFKDCELDVAEVFIERMGLKNAPEDWSGIWTMTTK